MTPLLPVYRSRLLATCALSAALFGACTRSPAPELIFHGGPVLTVNAHDEVAEALAVRDGIILAVGKVADLMKLKGPKTEMIDLHGQTLMPGFVGAHEHPTLRAMFNGAVNLSGFTYKTNAEVWQALGAAVAAAPKGQWLYAFGLDPILTPDLRIPTRKELDAMAPDQPLVLVAQTMHSYWANSKAFEEANITRETPDPGSGAYYERSAQGDLTGFVAEIRAAGPLMTNIQSPWKVYQRYVNVLDGLLANGFTTVASLGYGVPPILARVAASKHLHPRIRQFFYLGEDELRYLPDSAQSDNPYFRVLGIKLWDDGSPTTGTMYTSTPYLDTPLVRTLHIKPGSHGAAMIEEQALIDKLRKYTAQGWQVSIHSEGDISNREVLQAIAKAGVLPGAAPVVRMEHGLFLPRESLEQMAQLGVTVSFHINYIKYYGDALANEIVGIQAAQHILPVRTAFAQDVHPTLHADSPMFPTEGFSMMQTAISRATSTGQLLNPEQSINVQQALRAMTINGAYQLRLQNQTGSLEPRKWADLLVVARNPYTTPVEQLDAIKIQAVYVAGLQQFAAPGVKP